MVLGAVWAHHLSFTELRRVPLLETVHASSLSDSTMFGFLVVASVEDFACDGLRSLFGAGKADSDGGVGRSTLDSLRADPFDKDGRSGERIRIHGLKHFQMVRAGWIE